MPELLGNITIALFAVLCSLMLLLAVILVIIYGAKLIMEAIHLSFKEPQEPTENRPLRHSITPMTVLQNGKLEIAPPEDEKKGIVVEK